MQTCPQFRPEQLQLATARPLGAGAIAHVVRSTLRGPSRLPVAVKVVSKLQALQQKKVASVMNEKTALLRLAPHPFIARLYGTSQSEDELYFVLEWLPHGDLLQHIRRTASERVRAYAKRDAAATTRDAATAATSDAARDTADEAVALRPIPPHSSALRCLDFHDVQLITAQLVLALAHAFARGVVLRDLKPENVAFDAKHRACLLDFDVVDVDAAQLRPHSNHGVALPSSSSAAAAGPCATATASTQQQHDAHDSSSATPSLSTTTTSAPQRRRLTVSEIQRMRTRTASFCGTAQYVSPEMVGECCWSYSSDLWALGAMVYEMVYGVHMFAGVDAFSVLQKVIHGVAPQPRSSGGDDAGGALRVPFPYVDLGDEPAAFARMRDLVLRLMHTDPCARLSVDAATHTFDVAALQRHPFFAEVNWDALRAHERGFCPRTFATTDTNVTHDAADDGDTRNSNSNNNSDSDSESDVHGANEDEDEDALQRAMLAYSVDDTTPSLRAHYHVVPHNDAAYADYVYKATADANPFERFMRMLVYDTNNNNNDSCSSNSNTATKADSDAVGEQKTCTNSDNATTTVMSTRADDDDGDVDDVVDDVGMHYTGQPAAADFRD